MTCKARVLESFFLFLHHFFLILIQPTSKRYDHYKYQFFMGFRMVYVSRSSEIIHRNTSLVSFSMYTWTPIATRNWDLMFQRRLPCLILLLMTSTNFVLSKMPGCRVQLLPESRNWFDVMPSSRKTHLCRKQMCINSLCVPCCALEGNLTWVFVK